MELAVASKYKPLHEAPGPPEPLRLVADLGCRDRHPGAQQPALVEGSRARFGELVSRLAREADVQLVAVWPIYVSPHTTQSEVDP